MVSELFPDLFGGRVEECLDASLIVSFTPQLDFDFRKTHTVGDGQSFPRPGQILYPVFHMGFGEAENPHDSRFDAGFLLGPCKDKGNDRFIQHPFHFHRDTGKKKKKAALVGDDETAGGSDRVRYQS